MSNRLSKAARRKFSEVMRANWADPEWREKRCARLKEGSAARYAREAGLAVPLVDREIYSSVPKWVPPELRDDYRGFTRLYGEEIAAREVRAMKAEARA
jgi:hypothetical protein